MSDASRVHQQLVETARAQLQYSVAPYSRFAVGVALLCHDGTVVGGCNIEGTPTGLSSCAERTVLVKAISQGQRNFKSIAIVTAASKPCWPCGGCRQALFQHAPEIEVIVEGEQGDLIVVKLRVLLPQLA